MSVLGQGDSFARVLAAARRRRLHHGLMITGARGVGKSTAAMAVAKALLCGAPDGDAACGACTACRRVEAGQHADLHRVTVADDKRDIAVEQVREIQVTLGRHSTEGGPRVVIFDPADRLNEQSQNALLKTLEEPGADTFMLLAVTRPELLLETVRSRIGQLRLLPLTAAAVEEALAGRGAGDAEGRRLAAAHSAGSLGLALELVDAGVASMHQHLVELVERPNDISSIALARDLLAGAADQKAAEHRARLVLACLRGLMGESLRGSLALQGAGPYLADAYQPWAASLDCLFDAENDLDLRIAADQVLSFAFLRLREELPRLWALEAGHG